MEVYYYCENCGMIEGDLNVTYEQIRCDGGSVHNTLLDGEGRVVGQQCRECGATWDVWPWEVEHAPRNPFSINSLTELYNRWNDGNSVVEVDDIFLYFKNSMGQVGRREYSIDIRLYKNSGYTFADVVRMLSGVHLLQKYGAEKLRRKLRDNLNKAPETVIVEVCNSLGLYE